MNTVTYISFAHTDLDDKRNATMFWNEVEDGKVTKQLIKSNITPHGFYGYFGYAATGLVEARIPKNSSGVIWDAHLNVEDVTPSTLRKGYGFDPRCENLWEAWFDQDNNVLSEELIKTDSALYTVPYFQVISEKFWFIPFVQSNLKTFFEVQQQRTDQHTPNAIVPPKRGRPRVNKGDQK